MKSHGDMSHLGKIPLTMDSSTAGLRSVPGPAALAISNTTNPLVCMFPEPSYTKRLKEQIQELTQGYPPGGWGRTFVGGGGSITCQEGAALRGKGNTSGFANFTFGGVGPRSCSR